MLPSQVTDRVCVWWVKGEGEGGNGPDKPMAKPKLRVLIQHSTQLSERVSAALSGPTSSAIHVQNIKAPLRAAH